MLNFDPATTHESLKRSSPNLACVITSWIPPTKKKLGTEKGERAGASKGTPVDAKCVTEILRGTKIKEVGGTKFKFGELLFRKIIKIVATRCHILRLK